VRDGQKNPQEEKGHYAKKDEMERTDYDDGSRSIIVSSELEEAFKEQRKILMKH
jgi:hypothetical protein